MTLPPEWLAYWLHGIRQIKAHPLKHRKSTSTLDSPRAGVEIFAIGLNHAAVKSVAEKVS